MFYERHVYKHAENSDVAMKVLIAFGDECLVNWLRLSQTTGGKPTVISSELVRLDRLEAELEHWNDITETLEGEKKS